MSKVEKNFRVIFQPSGRRGDVLKGKTILEASRDLGVQIESTCGGKNTCGKCKVILEEGKLSPMTQEEEKFLTERERGAGYRMSCAARILGDVSIFVPEESRPLRQVVQKIAMERPIELKPAVSLYYIDLSPPTFQHCLGDFERVEKTLFEKYNLPSLDIDYPVLTKLPDVLRQGEWKATVAVWMGKEIIDIRPGKVDHVYGLAIDLGTTTVVAYLCCLQDGRLIDVESMMNPQIVYGEDVMSRITYAMTNPDGLVRLNRSIIEGLNALVQTMTGRCGLSSQDILELIIVGNTTMHHLFFKINPQHLGISPFTPAIHRSIDVKARHLGLNIHPSANVHALPIEAGFVGPDNVAVLIAEEPYNQDERVLIIDIGTNGELVMGNRKRLLSSSCATGPAFEGAHIQCGMRAAPGAIKKIRIDRETFEVDFEVIGAEDRQAQKKISKAIGICGSGVIDAVAEFYRTGIIDKTGRFQKDIPSPRLRISDGRPEFVIAWKDETSVEKDLIITQQDVRNVQLAKAALYTGAKLMMRKLGIERLDRVLLAGAFGSCIDPEKAMILGIFPDCDLKHVSAVGNAAGEGAKMALLNRDKREEARGIARRVQCIELTIEEGFQSEWMDAIQIPHGRDFFPHLRGIVKEEILNQ